MILDAAKRFHIGTLTIGNNVDIAREIFTLEHDPNSDVHDSRSDDVVIDRLPLDCLTGDDIAGSKNWPWSGCGVQCSGDQRRGAFFNCRRSPRPEDRRAHVSTEIHEEVFPVFPVTHCSIVREFFDNDENEEEF